MEKIEDVIITEIERIKSTLSEKEFTVSEAEPRGMELKGEDANLDVVFEGSVRFWLVRINLTDPVKGDKILLYPDKNTNSIIPRLYGQKYLLVLIKPGYSVDFLNIYAEDIPGYIEQYIDNKFQGFIVIKSPKITQNGNLEGWYEGICYLNEIGDKVFIKGFDSNPVRFKWGPKNDTMFIEKPPLYYKPLLK